MAAADDEALLLIQLERAEQYRTLSKKLCQRGDTKLNFLKASQAINSQYWNLLQDDFPDEILAMKLLEEKRSLLISVVENLEQDEFWQRLKSDLERNLIEIRENTDVSGNLDFGQFRKEIEKAKSQLKLKQDSLNEVEGRISVKLNEYNSLAMKKNQLIANIEQLQIQNVEDFRLLNTKNDSLASLDGRLEQNQMALVQKSEESVKNLNLVNAIRSEASTFELDLNGEYDKLISCKNDLVEKVSKVNSLQAEFEKKVLDLNCIENNLSDEQLRLDKLSEIAKVTDKRFKDEQKNNISVKKQIRLLDFNAKQLDEKVILLHKSISSRILKLVSEKQFKKERSILLSNCAKILKALDDIFKKENFDYTLKAQEAEILKQNIMYMKTYSTLLIKSGLVVAKNLKSINNQVVKSEFEQKAVASDLEQSLSKLLSIEKELVVNEKIGTAITRKKHEISRDLRFLEAKSSSLSKQLLFLSNGLVQINQDILSTHSNCFKYSDSIQLKKKELLELSNHNISLQTSINRLEKDISESKQITASIESLAKACVENQSRNLKNIALIEFDASRIQNARQSLANCNQKLKEEICADRQLEFQYDEEIDLSLKDYNSKVSESNTLEVKLGNLKSFFHELQLKYIDSELYKTKSIQGLLTIKSISNQLSTLQFNFQNLSESVPGFINHHVLRNKIAFNTELHKLLGDCERLRQSRSESVKKIDIARTKHIAIYKSIELITKKLNRLDGNFKAYKPVQKVHFPNDSIFENLDRVILENEKLQTKLIELKSK
eukprot:NODE_306_length_10184_cov_0.912246.p1 type:complete len:777 gc:universal NODE_306_length_10184_cov_0.912246:2870-540(-)